jgi:hypothetical protein
MYGHILVDDKLNILFFLTEQAADEIAGRSEQLAQVVHTDGFFLV